MAAFQHAAREGSIGLRGGDIGFRLHDLLVEIRGVDFGEQLPGLHRRADIDFQFLQVAADAREYLRLRIRFEPARKAEARTLDPHIGRRDRDHGQRLIFSPLAQAGIGHSPGGDARADDDGGDHNG